MMKKVIYGLLIAAMCGVTEGSFAATSTATTTQVTAQILGKGKSGKRKKNGKYKKRKGLFGKKSDCDCPKH